MTDLAIVLDEYGTGDLVMSGADLLLDEGLETAVIISMFTDRQVEDDELPDSETDRRGYWGDIANEDSNDKTGSKLWLLAREKSTEVVADRAKQYTEEALQWLKDDGVTNSIEVTTTIPRPGALLIEVTIARPSTNVSFRFDYLWQQQIAKRAA